MIAYAFLGSLYGQFKVSLNLRFPQESLHKSSAPADAGALECVKKVVCRGDHWSPADFAPAKFVAVRRKYGYFPSGNPKNGVFRRAIHDRPYNLNRREWFFDSLQRPGECRGTHAYSSWFSVTAPER